MLEAPMLPSCRETAGGEVLGPRRALMCRNACCRRSTLGAVRPSPASRPAVRRPAADPECASPTPARPLAVSRGGARRISAGGTRRRAARRLRAPSRRSSSLVAAAAGVGSRRSRRSCRSCGRRGRGQRRKAALMVCDRPAGGTRSASGPMQGRCDHPCRLSRPPQRRRTSTKLPPGLSGRCHPPAPKRGFSSRSATLAVPFPSFAPCCFRPRPSCACSDVSHPLAPVKHQALDDGTAQPAASLSLYPPRHIPLHLSTARPPPAHPAPRPPPALPSSCPQRSLPRCSLLFLSHGLKPSASPKLSFAARHSASRIACLTRHQGSRAWGAGRKPPARFGPAAAACRPCRQHGSIVHNLPLSSDGSPLWLKARLDTVSFTLSLTPSLSPLPPLPPQCVQPVLFVVAVRVHPPASYKTLSRQSQPVRHSTYRGMVPRVTAKCPANNLGAVLYALGKVVSRQRVSMSMPLPNRDSTGP